MIEVNSYYQPQNTVTRIAGEPPLIQIGIKVDVATFKFPTWRSAMAYIEELLEKGHSIVSAIQVEEST